MPCDHCAGGSSRKSAVSSAEDFGGSCCSHQAPHRQAEVRGSLAEDAGGSWCLCRSTSNAMAGGAPRKSGGVIPRKIIIITISLDWRKSAEVGVVKSRKSFLEFVVSIIARSSLSAGSRYPISDGWRSSAEVWRKMVAEVAIQKLWLA